MTEKGAQYTFMELAEGKDRKAFPLYFLDGDDEFLIKEAAGLLKNRLLLSNTREEDRASLLAFSFHALAGSRDTKAHEVMAVCLEYSILSPVRVVYLEGVNRLAAEEKDRLAKELEVPLPGTVLIMSMAPGDRRTVAGKKLEEQIKRRAATIICSMSEREAEDWIIHRLKRHGYEIRQDAAQLLRKRTGLDFWLLSIELSKLKAYCGQKKIISRQEIEAITIETPQARIYQITEQIMKGNIDAVISTFYELTANEEPSMGTLSYINRFFMGILESQKMVQETGSVREAAKALKKGEYLVRKNADLASLLTTPSLQKVIELCLQADLGMKKGKDKRIVYETLLIHLCSLFKKSENWS